MYNTTWLTFDPVIHSDTGIYQCQAFNYVSNMTSDPYELIVNCKYKSTISLYMCVSHVFVFVCDACSVSLLVYPSI